MHHHPHAVTSRRGVPLALLCILVTSTAASAYGQSLAEVQQRLRTGEPTRIVCFGDSITGAYYHTGGERAWCDMLGLALKAAFMDAQVQMINAGISGHTTENALARIEQDVLAREPHLVVVMFGMNDVTRVPLETYRRNLETIVAKCRAIQAAVVLCTPNSVIDNEARPNAKLAEYSAAVKECAAANDLPLVDLFAHWQELRREDDQAWRLLMSDEIHPNMNGHREFARRMAEVIAGQSLDWKEVPAPPAAIPHTIAQLRQGKKLKLVTRAPYDQVFLAAVRQHFPKAEVEVVLVPEGASSIAELRTWAEQIRSFKPDLVLAAVPVGTTAPDETQFIQDYEWVLNWSFPFEGRAWDVLPVLPRPSAQGTAEAAARRALMRSIIVGKDVAYIECPENDTQAAEQILAAFIREASAGR